MHLSYPTLAPYGVSTLHPDDLPRGSQPARVIRHDGGTLLGVTPDGERVLRLPARLDQQPVVGDWVAVPATPQADDPVPVLAVLPRSSLLRRLAADETGEQALAANVELVLVTCGADRPVRTGRIQRVAAQAWDCGATPALVITKAGRHPEAVDLPRLELEHPGMAVLVTSALEGLGLTEVRALVAGRTAVLVGESGAGKSTLTNALLGRVAAATGPVRAGDAKGRHTTSARVLHLLPGPAGGSLIDTPGIRAVGLAADVGAVDAVFPEIAELADQCRFSDCGHRSEPDCAVLEAVDIGALPADRYRDWLRLQREVANAALRSSPHELRSRDKQFSRLARSAAQYKRR